MEAACVLPPGTLARSEDFKLLQRYGVTTRQIAEKLKEIAAVALNSIQDDIAEAKRYESDSMTRLKINVGDVFSVEVKVFLGVIQKVECAYCKVHFPNSANFTITNIENNSIAKVPYFVIHLAEEHGDLGNLPPFRLAPPSACKVLNLGNTDIPVQDPLFEIAKYSAWPKSAIEKKKQDDAILNSFNISANQIGEMIESIVKQGELQLKVFKQLTNSLSSTTVVNSLYRIHWNQCFSYQSCKLCEGEPETAGYASGTIKNLTDGRAFSCSTLSIHYMKDHGYLDDAKPKTIAKALGLSYFGSSNLSDALALGL